VSLHLNTACTCKRANHMHGTRVCYIVDKCRCDLCRAANNMAARVHRERHLYAQYDPEKYAAYVDASGALAHIRTLQAAGLGWKTVAQRAGLSASVIYPLIYGKADRNGGKPRTKVRKATRTAILAVPVPAPEELRAGQRIDPTPTLNRVRALMRIGYSMNHIAREAGVDHQVIRYLRSRPSTSVRTHNAVRAAFRRLGMTPNAPTEWRAKIAANRSISRAIAEGYPSPLDLDDDGYIADLDADDVQRSWGVDLNEWLHLVRGGEDVARAAERLGVAIKAIEKRAYRDNRPDVLTYIYEARQAS